VTAARPHPILVTRPEEPGRGLTTALIKRGADALWLPAFELAPAPDAPAARQTLARLGAFDLAVFVSPAAVRATAVLLDAPWPSTTAVGAAGHATAEAVRARLRPAEGVRVVAPDEDDEGGSEALLRALDAAGVEAARVLILRAVSGREWLAERLAERGVQVETIAVYDRRAHVLTAAQRARLAQMGAQPIDSVFSSSDAIEALHAQLPDAAWSALRRGVAVASHTRIAQRLAAVGFARVRVAPLRADEILAALAEASQ
jgi:uroporphyrinogen-III synthase